MIAMKLTHDMECRTKADESTKAGPADEKKKGFFGRFPLSDKLIARIAVLVMAAATPYASCTLDVDGVLPVADGGHDSGPDADTDADVDHDAGPDADADVDLDGGPDSDADTDLDGGPDSDADVDLDGGPDADLDAGEDGGPDADLDAGEDAGPDADVDAGYPGCGTLATGNYVGAVNSTGQVVGSYRVRYIGPSGSNAIVEVGCEGGALLDPPQYTSSGGTIDITVTADGQSVHITVFNAFATYMNGSIDVTSP